MRRNNLDKQEIIKCFHCGNETPMQKVGEYSWGSQDLEYSDIDFLKFIYEAQRANLFPFEILEFYPTEENTQEFMIILKKNKYNRSNKVLELIDTYDSTTKEKNAKLLLEKQKETINNLSEKINCLEQKIIEKTREYETTYKNAEQLDEQLKRLAEEYDKIIKSRSWQMTKIFRKISLLIRK